MEAINVVAANLMDKYPVSLAFVSAGEMLGFRTANACYVARARGDFPVRVTRAGAGLRVMTHDLIDYITTGKSQAAIKPTSSTSTGKGRPSRVEQAEAIARGLSVRELRAQAKLGV